MVRRIIEIDQERCNGCGACAEACQEGAIAMKNGKAVLVRDDYCDGLGNCLPACPAGAISFVEREAAAFDEAAVSAAKHSAPTGCPGSRSQVLRPDAESCETASCLGQWPVQIKLMPLEAPYYNGARVLIAADCAAYACGDFHGRFLRGRTVMIGCPKLDEGDYSEKLAEIFGRNSIQEVLIVRMEVPCCGGLQRAAENALRQSGKSIPWQVVTLGRDGRILNVSGG